jgi:heme/copper-type cytochrome/quinol oxidase subunit 4
MSKRMRIYLLGSLILFALTTIAIRVAASYYGPDTRVPANIGMMIMLVFTNVIVSFIIFLYYIIRDLFK